MEQSERDLPEETVDVSTTPRPSPFAAAGQQLFRRQCDFLSAAAVIEQLPIVAAPEVAFAGRSNVGKSSLLNALTNRTRLARTSHSPGRTQQLNFFAIGDEIRLVDLPGYGYAAVTRQKIAAWAALTLAYLRGRPTLMRVFLLVDARHGLKDGDRGMMDHLDQVAVSYQIILTKADELKLGQDQAMMEATLAAIRQRPAAYPQVLMTSARTGAGIGELRAVIAQLLVERTSFKPV
jgi:GTP-binding protein